MKISISTFLMMLGLSFSHVAVAYQSRTTSQMRFCEKTQKWLPGDVKTSASKPSVVRRAQ